MRNRNENKLQKEKDEFAVVLDIINQENNYRNSSTIQAIGTKTYSLLELIPKPEADIKIGDKVYIGDGKRDEIQYIKRALYSDKLTNSAKSELIYTIMDIIDDREDEYINFLNNSGPITIRKHALELIPGVGKKHVKDLIEIREEKPFENFKDVKSRISFLSEPQKSFATRIIDEIEGNVERIFFIQR